MRRESEEESKRELKRDIESARQRDGACDSESVRLKRRSESERARESVARMRELERVWQERERYREERARGEVRERGRERKVRVCERKIVSESKQQKDKRETGMVNVASC